MLHYSVIFYNFARNFEQNLLKLTEFFNFKTFLPIA